MKSSRIVHSRAGIAPGDAIEHHICRQSPQIAGSRSRRARSLLGWNGHDFGTFRAERVRVRADRADALLHDRFHARCDSVARSFLQGPKWAQRRSAAATRSLTAGARIALSQAIRPRTEGVDGLLNEPWRVSREVGTEPPQIELGRLLAHPSPTRLVGSRRGRFSKRVHRPRHVRVDYHKFVAVNVREPRSKPRSEGRRRQSAYEHRREFAAYPMYSREPSHQERGSP